MTASVLPALCPGRRRAGGPARWRARLLAWWLATAVAPTVAAAQEAASPFWTLALRDTLRTPAGPVRLGEVATAPLPEEAAAVLLASGRAGEEIWIDRRLAIRRLVELGLAAGVELGGASRCRVIFTGAPVEAAEVGERVRALLGSHLPAAPEGAPPTWLEIALPAPALPPGDSCLVELAQPRQLRPGRNLVRVRVSRGGRTALVNASVVCHAYGLTARARAPVAAGAALEPQMFVWEWTDLAATPPGRAVSPADVAGHSAGRALAAGQQLARGDLKATPLVRRGETIDLTFGRGAVAATVRATARQDGLLGQVITVRNEVNGRLVAARVAGPGRVEGGR